MFWPTWVDALEDRIARIVEVIDLAIAWLQLAADSGRDAVERYLAHRLEALR